MLLTNHGIHNVTRRKQGIREAIGMDHLGIYFHFPQPYFRYMRTCGQILLRVYDFIIIILLALACQHVPGG